MSYSSIASDRKGWNRGKSAPNTVPRQSVRIGWRMVLQALVVLSAIAALTFWLCGDDQSESEAARGARQRRLQASPLRKLKNSSPKDAVRAVLQANERSSKPRKRKKPPTGMIKPDMLLSCFQGADRKIAESIQTALDANDCARTLREAEAALKSENPELRQHAVEAMAWFGEDALPELTEAMTDKDPDVASAAENAWELALSDVEDAENRFSVAAAALATLSDPVQLSSISGLMANSAAELIDGEDDDDKAAENRLGVVQYMVDLIEGGFSEDCVAEAKDAYSTITGEEWAGVDVAEEYLHSQYDYAAAEERKAAAEQQAADDAETGSTDDSNEEFSD